MYYSVAHLTDYHYSEPITHSVMELRMHPRSDEKQRCVRFDLHVSPSTKIFSHRDYLGNTIHTFDIPAPHERLAIKSEALVEVKSPAELPESLPEDTWEGYEAALEDRDIFDMLMPGRFTVETTLLHQFAQEIDWYRRSDPLSLLRQLNETIFNRFDYEQDVTKVDSPIDVTLESGRGVCQDFAHIMLTMTRNVGIPARYVSGYLFHRKDTHDRSVDDATHAWIEAWLPTLGWVSFDPTNNLIATDRHIRVSVGNDYATASPSKGVFTGKADTELVVRVGVKQLDELPVEDKPLSPEIVMPKYEYHQAQQAQQQ